MLCLCGYMYYRLCYLAKVKRDYYQMVVIEEYGDANIAPS